jgi:hypothetical protein
MHGNGELKCRREIPLVAALAGNVPGPPVSQWLRRRQHPAMARDQLAFLGHEAGHRPAELGHCSIRSGAKARVMRMILFDDLVGSGAFEGLFAQKRFAPTNVAGNLKDFGLTASPGRSTSGPDHSSSKLRTALSDLHKV